jgi:hypothetical protein
LQWNKKQLKFLIFWEVAFKHFVQVMNTLIVISAKNKVIGYHIHKRLILHTRLTDLSILYKEDITGYNWSNAPVILAKLGI